MSVPEVYWRFQQKKLMSSEKNNYSNCNISVADNFLYGVIQSVDTFNADALGINWSNLESNPKKGIQLLGGFDYNRYKKDWHAGFQTEKKWPVEFAYDLQYKQCDEIGDARTNWELHRHFQFALLAKLYFLTKDKSELGELIELFEDWNKHNPWLHGIAWVSVMEVAIRAISWMECLAFLKQSEGVPEEFIERVNIGIQNMIHYVSLHYSRYSSANNHLLVEATAIGLAGFAYKQDEWVRLAVSLLDEELYKQNFKDGVNKEVSLHYQTFVMEAYALMMHAMHANKTEIPTEWEALLDKMSIFVSSSMFTSTKACAFGDNDEGKILDLDGTYFSHYAYVLQFCSLLLNKKYHDFDATCTNIQWLFSEDQLAYIKSLPRCEHKSCTFSEGGYSFMRSTDDRILIGIDHAPLGFGSIAAHGHADALSFQLTLDGDELFIDPGTYIYHCWLNKRDKYRKTRHHNTVELEGQDQSQMLGAFLWGKRAECEVIKQEFSVDSDELIVAHNGYNATHQRQFIFDKNKQLLIKDEFNKGASFVSSFLIGPLFEVDFKDNIVFISKKGSKDVVAELCCKGDFEIRIETGYYSPEYGIERPIKAVRLYGEGSQINTSIKILK